MSYILTNLITALTDVVAARIPHSREWPVITSKNRWGNCLDANINLPKIWSECVLGLTHRGVAELSGTGRNEKDINAPFTRTLKQTPDLHSFGRSQHHLFLFFLTPSNRLQNIFKCFHSRDRMVKTFSPSVFRLVPSSDSYMMQGEDLLALVVPL